MLALRDAATVVLRDILSRQPDTSAKIAFAWKVAAGPALARAATISWLPDGTLLLRPSTPAWRREMARARPLVAERLTHLLGAGVVRRIVIERVP